MSAPDAVVVGSGPNGLAAAITLAAAGWRVDVREGAATIGGGVRSAELTLPGFVHDVCSAIHPMAVASPFFRTLPLAAHGLEWVDAPAPLAHPLDDGRAVVLERSVEATAAALGRDRAAWDALMRPLVDGWEGILGDVLGMPRWPRHPVRFARFGLRALRSASGLARGTFRTRGARALVAGLAAHAPVALGLPASASFGLVLGLTAHAVGWPMPRGGSQRLADALAAHLGALGGTVTAGAPVTDLAALGAPRAILCDVGPPAFLRLAAGRLSRTYAARLRRFRYGPGVFKLDWALREPIPWRAPACRRAGTVHLGGTLEEIEASERAAWRGEHAERPFVLLAQPTVFDPTRAPDGRHVGWAYCHVPNGSTVDMTDRIEAQVERFAPGFRDVILARATRGPAGFVRDNPNCVGGDVYGGALDVAQLLFRPVLSFAPHRTPARGIYLCSASTAPGPSVHGMCGHRAALAALADAR